MRLVLLLLVNFGALALGALFMGGSPAENEWYQQLNKAPWTPPGWAFGAAWSLIMLCFSFYIWLLLKLTATSQLKSLLVLFSCQWVLNVLWNPVFFLWHLTVLGSMIIFLLLVILLILYVKFSQRKTVLLFLIFPYVIWLLIALSLNVYVTVYN